MKTPFELLVDTHSSQLTRACKRALADLTHRRQQSRLWIHIRSAAPQEQPTQWIDLPIEQLCAFYFDLCFRVPDAVYNALEAAGFDEYFDDDDGDGEDADQRSSIPSRQPQIAQRPPPATAVIDEEYEDDTFHPNEETDANVMTLDASAVCEPFEQQSMSMEGADNFEDSTTIEAQQLLSQIATPPPRKPLRTPSAFTFAAAHTNVTPQQNLGVAPAHLHTGLDALATLDLDDARSSGEYESHASALMQAAHEAASRPKAGHGRSRKQQDDHQQQQSTGTSKKYPSEHVHLSPTTIPNRLNRVPLGSHSTPTAAHLLPSPNNGDEIEEDFASTEEDRPAPQQRHSSRSMQSSSRRMEYDDVAELSSSADDAASSSRPRSSFEESEETNEHQQQHPQQHTPVLPTRAPLGSRNMLVPAPAAGVGLTSSSLGTLERPKTSKRELAEPSHHHAMPTFDPLTMMAPMPSTHFAGGKAVLPNKPKLGALGSLSSSAHAFPSAGQHPPASLALTGTTSFDLRPKSRHRETLDQPPPHVVEKRGHRHEHGRERSSPQESDQDALEESNSSVSSNDNHHHHRHHHHRHTSLSNEPEILTLTTPPGSSFNSPAVESRSMSTVLEAEASSQPASASAESRPDTTESGASQNEPYREHFASQPTPPSALTSPTSGANGNAMTAEAANQLFQSSPGILRAHRRKKSVGLEAESLAAAAANEFERSTDSIDSNGSNGLEDSYAARSNRLAHPRASSSGNLSASASTGASPLPASEYEHLDSRSADGSAHGSPYHAPSVEKEQDSLRITQANPTALPTAISTAVRTPSPPPAASASPASPPSLNLQSSVTITSPLTSPSSGAPPSPLVMKACPPGQLCEICDDLRPTLYCMNCKMFLCEKGNCDAEVHNTEKLKQHQRQPLPGAGDATPITSPIQSPVAKTIAPATTITSPVSSPTSSGHNFTSPMNGSSIVPTAVSIKPLIADSTSSVSALGARRDVRAQIVVTPSVISPPPSAAVMNGSSTADATQKSPEPVARASASPRTSFHSPRTPLSARGGLVNLPHHILPRRFALKYDPPAIALIYDLIDCTDACIDQRVHDMPIDIDPRREPTDQIDTIVRRLYRHHRHYLGSQDQQPIVSVPQVINLAKKLVQQVALRAAK